jgi:FMN-dependent NADH-azoreductase
MSTLLHIDSSARPGNGAHPSHTRRLTKRFMERWRESRPTDRILYRDLAATPPRPVTHAWIEAAFTRLDQREPRMKAVLEESDALIDELGDADILLLGAPMYNFSVPAPLKAWIDNIVRVGRTFGFDRAREGEPYWPLLSDKGTTAVVVTSRGDFGYADRIRDRELVLPVISTALAYIGITDVRHVTVEYDEFGGDLLDASFARAEADLDALAERLISERASSRAEAA